MSFPNTVNQIVDAFNNGDWDEMSFRLRIFTGRLLHHRRTPLFLVGLSVVNMIFGVILLSPYSSNSLIEMVLPVTSARDVLKVGMPTNEQKSGPTAFQDYEWEQRYDLAEDPKNCSLNKPFSRPLHGCVVDEDTKIPYCTIQMLRIDPDLIGGPPGGEDLSDVMGRDEELEFPKYHEGAFTTSQPLEGLSADMNRRYWYYINDVLMSLEYDRKQRCKSTLSGTTLLLTRYEYVDLYHTLKDWWNAYHVLPGGKKANRVIFLDSHAKGQYDEVWQDLYSIEPIKHVNQLPAATCFERAILVPPGYSSVLWNLDRVFTGNRCPSMAKAFVSFFLKGYGLDSIKKSQDSVLILDQKPHVMHPRAQDTSSEYDNTLLFDIQAKMIEDTNATNAQVLDIQKLSFKSQLKTIRRTHILIGKEGSGGAVSFFLPEESAFLEIRDGGSSMEKMLRWNRAIKYESIFSTESKDLIRYEIVPHVKDVINPGWDAFERRYPKEYYLQENPVAGDDIAQNREGMGDDEFQNYTDPDGGFEGGFEGGFGQDRISKLENVEHDEANEYKQCALYGPERVTHGCVVDSDTYIPYCQMENLRVDSARMEGPPGGEPLDSVMGRNEDFEYLKYSPGAFSVLKDLKMPGEIDRRMMYHLNDILESLTKSNLKKHSCVETIRTPTLFITRYEYVNLFHTLTDWWNAFFAKPFDETINIVFLDAHAEGMMDQVWGKVFGKIYFAKQFPEGGVCFDKAIFVPAGYSAQLWPRDRTFRGKPCAAMSRAFINTFVSSYNKENVEMEQGRVTILDRVLSVTHPRSDPRNEDKPISNLFEIKAAIEKSVKAATAVDIIRLEEMEFEDQINVLRKSHVLIGHQDAGMSHLMFLPGGAHAIELQSSSQILELAKWKPSMTYSALSVYDRQISQDTIEKNVVPTVEALLTDKPLSSVSAGDDTITDW